MANISQNIPRIRPLQALTPEHVNRLIRDMNRALGQLHERIAKLPLATGKLIANLDANGFQISNLGSPTSDNHAVTPAMMQAEFEKIRDKVNSIVSSISTKEGGGNAGSQGGIAGGERVQSDAVSGDSGA